MKPILCVLLFVIPSVAQDIRAGLKAGVPLTDYFETQRGSSYSSSTRWFSFGPSAEWWPKRDFGVEFDALYHRLGYSANTSEFGEANGTRITTRFEVKGNSWDFPLTLKYRIGHAYLAGGGVLRHIGPVHASGETTTDIVGPSPPVATPIDTGEPPELSKRTFPGIVANVGFEFGNEWVRVLPEIRYTHWTANIGGSFEDPLVRFAPNQVEFHLGFNFCLKDCPSD